MVHISVFGTLYKVRIFHRLALWMILKVLLKSMKLTASGTWNSWQCSTHDYLGLNPTCSSHDFSSTVSNMQFRIIWQYALSSIDNSGHISPVITFIKVAFLWNEHNGAILPAFWYISRFPDLVTESTHPLYNHLSSNFHHFSIDSIHARCPCCSYGCWWPF